MADAFSASVFVEPTDFSGALLLPGFAPGFDPAAFCRCYKHDPLNEW